MRGNKAVGLGVILLTLSVITTGPAWGQRFAAAVRRIAPAGPAAAGTVNLPYTVMDNTGNQWMVYQYGQLQQQGNMPVYSQGAMLQINGAYPQMRNNQGRIDDKTGELILENMTANNCTITRRILFNKEEGWVRYIDIIKNTQNQDQTVNLMYTTNTNYGVQFASMVADPKKKDQNIAWVATTHANGRVAVEMFGGKGAKTVPTFTYQQGNNSVQMSCSPSVPRGKEVAIMHFHMTTATADAGTKFVLGLKESKVMAGIPSAVRKLIINFRGGENFVGDYEILRGDILDVVELRSGDQLRGTLKEKSYQLQTFYGNIDLPVDKVIGMINVGDFRPRQLLVTVDGEIFGGSLQRDKLALELSSGQLTEIPISQVLRMGYRKRTAEPEEWTFEKPMVMMRTGDRIGVQMPTTPIEITTRYGGMKLKPDVIAAINFQVEEHPIHEILLTDGSRFAGLVGGDLFEMKLSGGGPEQTVRFPVSSIRRLQFAVPKTDEAEDEQASLNLANEDSLAGTLTGTLKLDTAFSTITVNAGEIKRLVHTAGAPSDVQMTLWDDTCVSGQLQEQTVACQLRSGVEIKVPVALVEEYTQPRPQASGALVENIKTLAAQLSSEDWKQRDAAQEKLVTMGPVVISTLKQLRTTLTPEAQQRIDLIVKQVEGSEPGKAKPSPAGAGTPPPPMIMQ